MNDALHGNPIETMAPADARPAKTWPLWRKLIAYLLLIVLASISIWFIDRDAMREQNRQIENGNSKIAK